MVKRLNYLVAYLCDGGSGRLFLDSVHPLDTEERIVEIEAMVARQYDRKNVGITNIILLTGKDA